MSKAETFLVIYFAKGILMKQSYIPAQQQDKPKTLTYEEAIHHIEQIYGKTYEFDDGCVCGFEYSVKDKDIIDCSMIYDKILVKYKDQPIYWPIQPHKEKVVNGKNLDLVEKFTRRGEA